MSDADRRWLQVAPEGVLRFHVDLRVDLNKMATWPPAAISKFFEGIALSQEALQYARTHTARALPAAPAATDPRLGTTPITPAEQIGTWPPRCVQRAFVAGAKWWEYKQTGATMWGADVQAASDEAVRRYGDPEAAPAAPADRPDAGAGEVCDAD